MAPSHARRFARLAGLALLLIGCGASELHYVKFNVNEGGKPVEVSKFFLDGDLTADGPFSRSFKATQAGDLPGAEKILTEELAKNPSDPWWHHYDLGILYEATAQWDKADAEMREAQKLQSAKNQKPEARFAEEIAFIAHHKGK